MEEHIETMEDYKEELEASFRRICEGDILTATVIAVTEEEATLDLKYYAPGIIKAADLSDDPITRFLPTCIPETRSRLRLYGWMTETAISCCPKKKQTRCLAGRS